MATGTLGVGVMRWDVATMEGFELATARTTIRHWRDDEADLLFAIRRRPEIARWLGDPTPWTDADQARAHLRRWREDATWAVPSSCAIVPDDVGEPVGTVTLCALPSPDRGVVRVADCAWLDDRGPVVDELEVGWYLHPDAVGRGWASEAATAMLGHGFAHGATRLWALMWAHNQASAAVAHRVGMAELGVLLDPWYGTADDTDSRIFLAERDTWSAPSNPTPRRVVR